jgi:hypothetical protein
MVCAMLMEGGDGGERAEIGNRVRRPTNRSTGSISAYYQSGFKKISNTVKKKSHTKKNSLFYNFITQYMNLMMFTRENAP